MLAGGDVPGFAVVYPASPVGFPTPRLAAYVWAAAGMLGEIYRRSEAWPGLVADLPRIVRRLVDDEWMASFVACFDALADRVACGGYESEQLARCTAEEMALHWSSTPPRTSQSRAR